MEWYRVAIAYAIPGAALIGVACGPSAAPDSARDASTSTPDAVDAAAPDAPASADDGVFPDAPIVDDGTPPNAPGLFDVPDGVGPGACVIEPQAGSLFPHGWLRARFRFEPPAGHNLFQIRLSAASEPYDLVVYTAATTWTMPRDVWDAMNRELVDEPIEVVVRSARVTGNALDGPPVASELGQFTIAPAAATGSVVYWTSGPTGAEPALNGFDIGDETVAEILRPDELGIGCIGCHESTPDGDFVAFSANIAPSDGRPGFPDVRSLDGTASVPSYVTPAASTLLARAYQHQPVFSNAHWSDGDRIVVTTFEVGDATELIWTDLEAKSEAEAVGWGVFARTGDAGNAAAPAFSHDGTRIAYSSATVVTGGMNLDTGGGDIYVIPFGDRAGGVAEPLAGASLPGVTEHYAEFSADDRFIAFTRTPGTEGSYNNPNAELYVVPAAGGTPERLRANDPAACSTATGLNNSWPKWSPKVVSVGDKRYYWLTFASRRAAASGFRPQLYVAAIVADETSIVTYPALYLWNQPEGENNHTPVWDTINIVVD